VWFALFAEVGNRFIHI